MRPNHHRVAVDRDAVAEFVFIRAVFRGQLGALQVLDRCLRQSSKAPDGYEIGSRLCSDREEGPRRDDQRQDDEHPKKVAEQNFHF